MLTNLLDWMVTGDWNHTQHEQEREDAMYAEMRGVLDENFFPKEEECEPNQK